MRAIVLRAWSLGLVGLLVMFFISVASFVAGPLPPIVGGAGVAHADAPDLKELQELNAASFDSAQAARVVPRARALLAQGLDPNYQMFLRQIILRSKVRSYAPVAEIASAADSVASLFAENPSALAQFQGSMARAFLERGDAVEMAYTYARRSLETCPDGPAFAIARSECLTTLGTVEIARGHHAEAIARLTEALPAARDSHAVLLALGQAFERSGKTGPAIDSYVRALGTFPCQDTTARGSLGALYAKQPHGAAELEARIDAACKASRKMVALDAHRHERPAPDWSLRDFEGKTVNFADLKGKVVVIDFWGSWCGPCRAELPFFQAMYERFRGKGVAFVGISWERVKTREEAVRASRQFMEQNRLSFPSVVDHDRVAVEAYRVDSFPTVFLIDKTGKVRYRNIGFSQDIEHILAAQIESLM